MHTKKSKGYIVFNVLNILFMILLGIVMIFPYLNTLAKAFNDAADSARGGLTIFREISLLRILKLF